MNELISAHKQKEQIDENIKKTRRRHDVLQKIANRIKEDQTDTLQDHLLQIQGEKSEWQLFKDNSIEYIQNLMNENFSKYKKGIINQILYITIIYLFEKEKLAQEKSTQQCLLYEHEMVGIVSLVRLYEKILLYEGH